MVRKTNRLVRLAGVRAAAQAGTLKDVRLASKLSLREVADGVGAGVSTVWRWENGGRRPSGKAALRYADLIAELEERLRVEEVGNGDVRGQDP